MISHPNGNKIPEGLHYMPEKRKFSTLNTCITALLRMLQNVGRIGHGKKTCLKTARR